MKGVIIFLLLLLFSNCVFGLAEKKAEKKSEKKADDKVYTVPQMKSEILLESYAPPLKKNINKRPQNIFYMGITRGSLTYKLPSLISGVSHFSPDLIGVNIGKKTGNALSIFNGNYEVSGEWQRFKREFGSFSQKINVFQLNLIQNIDLAWSFKRSLFFSAGVGVTPVYLTAEQSVFGNSLSKFGAMGLLKFDLIFPFKKQTEFVLSLKSGWGSVGGSEIFLSTVGFGMNFE